MRLLLKVVRWATYLALCCTALMIILGAVGIYVDTKLIEFDRRLCERQSACQDDACCADYLGL
jgi:hypothetical protein